MRTCQAVRDADFLDALALKQGFEHAVRSLGHRIRKTLAHPVRRVAGDPDDLHDDLWAQCKASWMSDISLGYNLSIFLKPQS